MLDHERILAKIDELEGYLREIRGIIPKSFDGYLKIVEKRRASERLLQISIESAIDICNLFVSGLRLGLPAEEDDLFEKLLEAGIISSELRDILKSMKGFRNILVHEYGRIDNAIVYEVITERLGDFEVFKKEILKVLQGK
ncbi:MAG: DUF86 domain-containing protein [Nitrospirae bacterium]|nr:DUF86 domain-containing protein [Nitrospirota bacterium]